MSSLNAIHIALATLIATAAVEILKDATPLRYAFNRWAVQRWLWRGLDLELRWRSQLWAIVRGKWLEENSIYHPKSPDANLHASLERDVVDLAACGQRAALYRPELAQIAGQLHLLAERLMDFPAQGPIVLRAIAGVSEVRLAKARPQPDEDLKRLAGMSDGFRAALAKEEAASPPPGSDDRPSSSAAAGALMDTRTRVTAWVQGRLNELQTTGRTAWRVVLLVLAIAIGIAVFKVANQGTWVDGLFAGLLAPIASEFLSMIKRVGRP